MTRYNIIYAYLTSILRLIPKNLWAAELINVKLSSEYVRGKGHCDMFDYCLIISLGCKISKTIHGWWFFCH